MENWSQIGQDFQQKYQETFCRYISPVTKLKEVFYVRKVEPKPKEGPSIVLNNQRAGDLYLKYDTGAELDFSFPEFGNFLYSVKKMALRIRKLHFRQWKKGVCSETLAIEFPYRVIYEYGYIPDMFEEMLEDAYKPRKEYSIREAIHLIENEDYFSIPLSNQLSLGIGSTQHELYLWHGLEPVGRVVKSKTPLRNIELHVSEFKQEVADFLNKTGDYAREIVQVAKETNI